jgi:hypothetical protein
MRFIAMTAVMWLGVGIVYAEDSQTVGLAPGEAEQGFVSLFDGKTLNGWQGDVKGYPVEDGVIVCRGGDVYSAKEYANFVLRFEFKLPPGGNNGVSIRTPLGSKLPSAFSGMEIQILDDGHPMYKDLHAYQAHGSVYGVVPAKRGFLKPVGQWNQEEIIADGPHIKVTLNGTVITDVDLSTIDKPMDGQAHPGLHNTKGYIGWAGHGDPVSFRNIRVKELP